MDTPTPTPTPTPTSSPTPSTRANSDAGTSPVVPSDAELKARLTPADYHITREGGTERAFTGAYWNEKADGTYLCKCCGIELFDASTKFDSGTGWPSFSDVVNSEAVKTLEDRSHGMLRVEAQCARCSAHLGHVFPDGPSDTGLRYCINSASLDLQPRAKD